MIELSEWIDIEPEIYQLRGGASLLGHMAASSEETTEDELATGRVLIESSVDCIERAVRSALCRHRATRMKGHQAGGSFRAGPPAGCIRRMQHARADTGTLRLSI
jgi:hypothetical protein